MSYTSVYELYSTKVKRISELQNAHGSGPAIWNYISNKLTGKDFDFFNADEFWSLWKDIRLDDNERAVLLSTYDRSYIEIDKLSVFSDACNEVSDLIITHTNWTWNHFADIGIVSRKLSDKHDYRCKGLCIGCTSVSDEWEFNDIESMSVWAVYEQIQSLKQ
ncbi:MAG: hypothetical protein H6937_02170 [Burkholderiales bacterium]|nr:hypothetical protein [Burkholderiales bacterium]